MGSTGTSTYGTVEYIDQDGEWQCEGVYFTWKESWRETIDSVTRILRMLHGAPNVARVMRLNGNAA